VTWLAPRLDPHDPANYVEVARNLLAGQGLSSQVVGNFYRRYPQVLHPEDRRPSAWSFVLAASMALFGETPFAALLPNLLLGLLVGPLLVYLLARRLHLAPVVCLAAAALFLSWPYWLKEALGAGADVLFTDLALLALISLLSARDRPASILATGAALGLAYTVKPAALLLVLPLAGVYWMDAARLPVSRRLGWLTGFVAVVVLFASPMVVRNYTTFGQPLYSTNTYTAGHIRSDASGQALLHVYWGQPLPSFSRWLAQAGPAGAGAATGRELGRCLLLLFGGIGLFFLLPSVVVVLGLRYQRRLQVLWIFPALFVLELASVWIVLPRYLLPVLPIITISAAAGGMVIAQRLCQIRRPAEAGFLAVVVLVASLGAGGYSYWRVDKQQTDSSLDAHIGVARWLRSGLPPGAVVMAHYPYIIRFYSDHPVVQIPFDSAEAIRRVCHHYGVDALVVPTVLPGPRWAEGLPREELLRLVAQAGWEPVYQNGGAIVFRPPR